MHHQLNGRKSEQTPGDSEGQGSLECCSAWGHKELDLMTGDLVTEQQQQGACILSQIFPKTHSSWSNNQLDWINECKEIHGKHFYV